VWVEKPMTATADEARRLVDEAAAAGRLLHVDHTFVYTGAVRKIHELIHSDGVGEIYYYDSTRVNLGLFQHDVNVIWDLAVHDVSIMDYLLPTQARAVSATGIAHVDGALEDIAYLTFFFDGNLIGHVNVNWLAPVKIRRTLIGGSRRMIVYDDLEPSEKIKVYDKGITVTSDPARVYQMKIGYRSGDMWAPQVDIGEALQLEVRHFAECIAAGRPTDTDGRAGLRMVQALEAATESMRDRGRVIELEQV
jgi:predicted dehydrogenase